MKITSKNPATKTSKNIKISRTVKTERISMKLFIISSLQVAVLTLLILVKCVTMSVVSEQNGYGGDSGDGYSGGQQMGIIGNEAPMLRAKRWIVSGGGG